MKRVTRKPQPQPSADPAREQSAAGITQRRLSEERREQEGLPPRGQRKDSERPTPAQHKPRQPELEDESAAKAARELDETD